MACAHAVIEDLVIDLNKKYISLESALGPFNFFIKGQINSYDQAAGALNFQFMAVDIALFGNKVGGAARHMARCSACGWSIVTWGTTAVCASRC